MAIAPQDIVYNWRKNVYRDTYGLLKMSFSAQTENYKRILRGELGTGHGQIYIENVKNVRNVPLKRTIRSCCYAIRTLSFNKWWVVRKFDLEADSTH